MKYNPEIHHRKSTRLKDYDYSKDGAYFVTICTQNREPFFGEIVGKKMVLNPIGNIAKECWMEIPQHYPNVILDEFIVMPNHVHGIFFIQNQSIDTAEIPLVGVQNFEPLPREGQKYKTHQFQKTLPRSVGSIVRGYKIGVTKWIRENTDIFKLWQRNYHDHIITDEDELNRIRKYIRDNPKNWAEDELNGLVGVQNSEPLQDRKFSNKPL